MATSSITLFTGVTIVTVDAEQTIWLDGALLVEGTRIAALGKTSALLQHPLLRLDQHQHHPAPVVQTVDCRGKIIIPGLVNTHAHLGQSLLRGLAEDVPLHTWLCDAIWPLEASYEADDGYVASRLTIGEMLKSGTTCFLEALLTPRTGFDNAARAVEEMGIRACLGKLVKDKEKNDIGLTDARDQDIASMTIAAALAARETYHQSCDGRLHVWMAAGTPRGTDEASHRAIGDACAAHGMGLTMHCAEAPRDLDIYRDVYGCSPVEFCARTNLVGRGRHTVLAHMVNLDLAKDLPLLAATGTAVAHNASSNCKLASGLAAVPDMLRAGVTVGLGTDGAPCANTYDMLQEMRVAALLQKGSRRDAAAMTAEQVLRMATMGGARALGLDEEIGSLEVGKKADLVVLDPSSALHCAPFDAGQVLRGAMDPITAVVFSCSGADVDKVVVDGALVVDGGRLQRCDEAELIEAARLAIARIRDGSGIRSKLERNYR